MDFKNQLTKTPFLVLFIFLGAISIGTASALITITLAGDVIIDPGNLLVVGPDGFDEVTDKARVSLGDTNHFIESEAGKGVTIGTYLKPNAIFIEEGTGIVAIDGPITSPTITDLQNQISHTSLPSQVIVSIQESGAPGCEENNSCVTPFEVRVAVGGEVTWNNDSPTSHWLQSGTAAGGPSGEFDSGFMSSGNSFDHTFNQEGTFPYFDLVHPWTTGFVLVGDLHNLDERCDNCILGFYEISESEAGVANEILTHEPACEFGDKAVAGGFSLNDSDFLLTNRPLGDSAWQIRIINPSSGFTSVGYVICADYTPVHTP